MDKCTSGPQRQEFTSIVICPCVIQCHIKYLVLANLYILQSGHRVATEHTLMLVSVDKYKNIIVCQLKDLTLAVFILIRPAAGKIVY